MLFLSTARTLLATAALVGVATAHNIVLPAHGRECFHETLHKDDTMTVTFQVGDREFGSAGNLDIDFWVRPMGEKERGNGDVNQKMTDLEPCWSIRDQ